MRVCSWAGFWSKSCENTLPATSTQTSAVPEDELANDRGLAQLGTHKQSRALGTSTRKLLWQILSFPYVCLRTESQEGRGRGTDYVWGQTRCDRERVETSRAPVTQENSSFCTWQSPITSLPDWTSRQQVCMTESCITALARNRKWD